MEYLFAEILFACFILALYFIFSITAKKLYKYSFVKIFMGFCLSSAIWSFGFFGVFMQKIPENAYAWRAVGMIGTFGYLILSQFLIASFTDLAKWHKYWVQGFSLSGIIIYFFTIPKSQTTFTYTKWGMAYSLTPGLFNTIYVAYSLIIAFNLTTIIIHILRTAKTKHLKVLGLKLLFAEFIIFLGMLLDTLFPMIGFPAIPGSSISQFIGLAILYHTILYYNRSRITVDNMSSYIFYSLTVPVLVFNANHTLKILNDTAYSFFEIRKDNMYIKKITELFNIDIPNIYDFEGNAESIDAVCKKNGLYCNLSVNKIYDNYGDIIGHIVIVTDLSDRIQSMKRLEEAIIEAENANKAKSTFLANMSHEIRTPMNAIIGFSELILKMDINAEVREHIEDIKRSSHNLLAIINDILDISKIESGKMEIICDNYYTKYLFNDVSLIVAPQAEKKGIEYTTTIDENIPQQLYGDKIRLRGIIINLINNAIKYTPKGSVHFEVSILSQTESNIRLSFKVTDTGIGIKEENMKKLFENFARLDQKINHGIEGTGLGLAITNGFIKLMGGDLTVESVYGEGSTFTAIIDQKIVDATPLGKDFMTNINSQHSENISNMKIKNTKVLVTDDNLINLRVANGIFSFYGLEVDTASSGADAIELCKKINYDLVFMDQMMPEMNGIEAMNEIRKLNYHYSEEGLAKIIVLTADAIKGTKENLLKLGFDEYLGKPINVTQLERIFKTFIPEGNIYIEESAEDNTNSPEDITFLEDNMKNVDVKLGITNSGGSLNEYLDILKITYEYGEKQLHELEQFWDAKDYENYVIKIHSIKSTSLNIGAADISAQAKAQEEKGRAGEFDYIANTKEAFMADYIELLNNLHTVLEHYGCLDELVDSEIQALDDKDIIIALKSIKRYVEDFDFNKVFEILDEISKYQLPDNYSDTIVKISELMEELQTDEILEIIEEKLTTQ